MHNWHEVEGQFLAFLLLCCEASVFLSTKETSNPVFTRGGVTPATVQAKILSQNAVQTESLSVPGAGCSVICLLYNHF